MNRRNFLTTVGATATTTTALNGLLGTTEPSQQGGAPNNSCETPSGGSDNAAATTPTGDVTVLEHELFKSFLDNAEVRGTVENTSGEPQSYIEVSAVFFDDQDVRLGTTMWNATDVPPGQVLEFETAMSTTPYGDVARYEVTGDTSAL